MTKRIFFKNSNACNYYDYYNDYDMIINYYYKFMNRLQSLNLQFVAQIAAKPKPTTDVWESMGLDDFLRPSAVTKKKAVGDMMRDNYDRLIPHINESSMPFWIVPKF